MNKHDIWHERLQLDSARRKKREECMLQYDKEVYSPAKQKLIENCQTITNHKFVFHGRGLFGETTIYRCEYCGVCKIEEN